MHRNYLSAVICLLLGLISIQAAHSQDRELIFIFSSKSALKEILNRPVEKTVSFEISGLRDDNEAKQLCESILSGSSHVIDMKISEASGGTRNATMTLAPSGTVANFSKVLITNQVRMIMLGQEKVRTETLNGQD